MVKSEVFGIEFDMYIYLNITGEAMRSFFMNESSSKDDDSCFPSLSFNERLIGFGICLVVGKVIINLRIYHSNFIIWIFFEPSNG